MTARLCSGCDAPLHQGFCPSCDDVMPSYAYTAEDFGGEVLSVNGSGSYLGVVRSPVMMGAACFDGEIVSPSVAGELRSLGRLAA